MKRYDRIGQLIEVGSIVAHSASDSYAGASIYVVIRLNDKQCTMHTGTSLAYDTLINITMNMDVVAPHKAMEMLREHKHKFDYSLPKPKSPKYVIYQYQGAYTVVPTTDYTKLDSCHEAAKNLFGLEGRDGKLWTLYQSKHSDDYRYRHYSKRNDPLPSPDAYGKWVSYYHANAKCVYGPRSIPKDLMNNLYKIWDEKEFLDICAKDNFIIGNHLANQ